jgi:hypothetical protein
MAGRVVQIVPKTKYTFNNAASTTSTIVLGPRAIMTPDWVSGVVSVRIHSSSFASASASVTVNVYNAYITPEDPNTLFLSTATVGTAGPITNVTPTGATAGSLLTGALSGIGGMLAVQLALSQGVTTGATTVEVSVDLIGRDN